MGNKMNIGYIRNSRLVQENSVKTQQTLINDFCKTHDINLDKIIVDEGISGSGEKTTKRDGYNSVMDMINNGEVYTLVVISISRWGRNLGEIYNSVRVMEKKNTKFLSIKEIFMSILKRKNFLLNLYLSKLRIILKEG